jgi:hypothetical protein
MGDLPPAPAPAQPPKISIPEGRVLLSVSFEPGPNAGPRGECWIRKRDGHPVFVTYAGPPWGEYFMAESVHDALAMA